MSYAPCTSANEAPQLRVLAAACNEGACNPKGIINSLALAMPELRAEEVGRHPAVKIIIGQLGFLCGESLGPTAQAIEQYEEWKGGAK